MNIKTNSSISPLSLKSQLQPAPHKDPQFWQTVKNRQGQSLKVGDPRATRALLSIMNLSAVNGGAACHWGGPSAFAEIMSAIHGKMFSDSIEHSSPKKNWFELYNFLNDAGHTENGIYALRANLGYANLTFEDLLQFRSINSPLTGHGEVHENPQGVLISNGPLGSAVGVAQGLALADKLLGNERVTVLTLSDGGAMEGEAKEALSAIPGLAQKGKLNPMIVVLSDNNTKLSGRIDADSYSMNPTFKSYLDLGWKVLVGPNGHNLQEVFSLFENAVHLIKENPLQPVLLHFKTQKGYPVESTLKSSSGGHGFPLKKNDPKIIDFLNEIYQGETPPQVFLDLANTLIKPPLARVTPGLQYPIAVSEKSEKVQEGVSKALKWAVENKYPVFSVSADLQGSTGLGNFHKEFPDHFVDVGVAEANMVSTATGLSKAGFIPLVDTFAQFGITKGNLPLIMTNLSLAPIIGIFSHTGMQDAADGASHQATTYFAATSAIPHTEVICCSCSMEMEFFLKKTIENFKTSQENSEFTPTTLFFLGRENFPAHYGVTDFEWGEGQVLYSGSEQSKSHNKPLLIVTTGPMVEVALKSVKKLEEKGFSPVVYNQPFINRSPSLTLKKLLKQCQFKLMTLEDHQMVGGMGSQLIHKLSQELLPVQAQSVALKGVFGRSAYGAQELYDHFQVNEEEIFLSAQRLWKENSL
jgi:transketolase